MACPGSSGKDFLLIEQLRESLSLLKPADSATTNVGMLR